VNYGSCSDGSALCPPWSVIVALGFQGAHPDVQDSTFDGQRIDGKGCGLRCLPFGGGYNWLGASHGARKAPLFLNTVNPFK